MNKISIVLPAYNEEKMVAEARSVISNILLKENIEYEIVFVNDGSKDKTWEQIEEISKKDSRVVGIHFSRNFGKESAIFAGLANATGDCCVVMDCDLQHPPEIIIEMYSLWKQGYKVVEGVKRSRGKENVFYKLSAGIFYKIISKATQMDMSRASDFKLLDRRVVEILLEMHEKNAFFRALSSWVGFEKTQIEFDVRERKEGESKWSTKSLVQYAITNIVAFSAAPMQFVTIAGCTMFCLAIILGIQTLIKYMKGLAVEGFTTVILLILFSGSLTMISLGIIGYYIAKIYEEIKQRPRYIISKIVRNDV